MSEQTYGPAEVYAAAGVSRGVAHSWISRGYFVLSPSPGMGRERRFSFNEAFLIAVAADLTRFGLTIGSASAAAVEVVWWSNEKDQCSQILAYTAVRIYPVSSWRDYIKDGPVLIIDAGMIRQRTLKSLNASAATEITQTC